MRSSASRCDPPAACLRKDFKSCCHHSDRVWRRWSSGFFFFCVSFNMFSLPTFLSFHSALVLLSLRCYARPPAKDSHFQFGHGIFAATMRTTWIGDRGLRVVLKIKIVRGTSIFHPNHFLFVLCFCLGGGTCGVGDCRCSGDVGPQRNTMWVGEGCAVSSAFAP
jgi:hypothetical protein